MLHKILSNLASLGGEHRARQARAPANSSCSGHQTELGKLHISCALISRLPNRHLRHTTTIPHARYSYTQHHRAQLLENDVNAESSKSVPAQDSCLCILRHTSPRTIA